MLHYSIYEGEKGSLGDKKQRPSFHVERGALKGIHDSCRQKTDLPLNMNEHR